MSLAKLTSLSTQTLSLLLERQRLHTMGQPPPASATQNISRNLTQLRVGILELESKDAGGGQVEAVKLLRNQFRRMREMLGSDAEVVEPLPPREGTSEQPLSSPPTALPSFPPKAQPFVPYSDEPPPSPEMEPTAMLQQQRMLMNEQDAHLEHLSQSVGRQHDISIQINGELEVHSGLLEDLDHGLDDTQIRLTGARRKLDRFSRGVKGNCSTITITTLIIILLILIVIFKT